MKGQSAAARMLEILHDIEERRIDRVLQSYHPEIEFHWPPGLPYSGVYKSSDMEEMNRRFGATWLPLQPDEETRRMNARVVATDDNGRVIVKYLWKGLAANGRRFQTETLAEYQVRDDRLLRAQMFYFDLTGMISFLEEVQTALGRA